MGVAVCSPDPDKGEANVVLKISFYNKWLLPDLIEG